MDPISCLGVAAAALQFLDFSLKTIKIYRSISSDAQSSGSINADIQQHSRHIKDLASEVAASVTSSSKVDSRLVQVAGRCVTKADELAAVLSTLQPPSSPKFLVKAKATVRALRYKDKIEKLARDLEKERELLASCELTKIIEQLDQAYISQQKDAVDIRKNLDTLAVKLSLEVANLRSEQSTTTGVVIDRVEGLSKHITTLISNQSIGLHTSIQNVHDRVDRGFQELSVATSERQNCDALLRSLFFKQQYARRDNVKDPHPLTFRWIHDKQQRLNRVKGSNLQEWLASDKALYWIQGKAGSGKSTLMKYIVDDEATLTALKAWSGTRPLIVASFFFWRAGTSLEKSVIGLLRSMLYQICSHDRALGNLLMNGYQLVDGMIPTWTQSRSLSALYRILREATGTVFCLFIDGLDEYQGDYLEFLDVIIGLQAEANVKICISSRPEIEFVTHLIECPQLCLQDLNYYDITFLVNDTLKDNADHSALAKTICRRADGVFLWAALVSQDVRKGIVAGDKLEVLEKRVESLPLMLHELYSQMLADVDAVHLESLRFFTRTLIDHKARNNLDPPSVALVAAAQLTSDITSYEAFAHECTHVKQQIVACSRGLLQMHQDRVIDYKNLESVSCANMSDWMDTRNMSTTELLTQRIGVLRSRTHQSHLTSALEEFTSSERTKIEFVHRSAYDFVVNEESRLSVGPEEESQDEFENRYLTAYLRLLLVRPIIRLPTLLYRSRYEDALKYASRMSQRPPSEFHNQKFILMDQLVVLLEHMILAQDIDQHKGLRSYRGETIVQVFDKFDRTSWGEWKTIPWDMTDGRSLLSAETIGRFELFDYLGARLVPNTSSNFSLLTTTYIILALAYQLNAVRSSRSTIAQSGKVSSAALGTAFNDMFSRAVETLSSFIDQAPKLNTRSMSFGLAPVAEPNMDILRTYEFSWLKDRILPEEAQCRTNIVKASCMIGKVQIVEPNSKLGKAVASMRSIAEKLHLCI